MRKDKGAAWKLHQETRDKAGKMLDRYLTNIHRQKAVSNASEGNGLFTMARWAQNRSTRKQTHMPDLVRTNGNKATTQKEKADALMEAFVPIPLLADLSDIEGYEYRDSPIRWEPIKMSEIRQAIGRTAPNKAPGMDGITNQVLKEAAKSTKFMEVLLRLYNTSMDFGYYPTHFKKPMTVALPKSGKDDNIALKSYRLIALLNMLGKVLKSIITE